MKSNIYLLLLGASIFLTSFAKPAPTTAEMECHVFVPNAFSPNDDGVNDIFLPNIGCPISDFDFKVFDRWGRMVFSSTNQDFGWDGEFDGQPAPTNVYVYVLTFKYDDEGDLEDAIEMGDVALIR